MIHACIADLCVRYHKANALRTQKNIVARAIYKEIAQGNNKYISDVPLPVAIELWLKKRGYTVRGNTEVYW